MRRIKPYDGKIPTEDFIVLQEQESARFTYFIGKDVMQNFGETFDDFTLLHYDDEYAQKVGFQRRVVQGALISCIIVKSIVRAFGDSAILQSHHLEFRKPIYPESEIMVELYVLSNIKNKLITLRSRVYIGDTYHFEGMTTIKVFENI
jgi:acyl dehydratase